MSACGSGKSSKGGGSKSKGRSCKGDALIKKVHLKTEKHHLATLRNALRDELGHDRDVLSGFGAFTKYDREGLELDVHFRTGASISDEELEWAYELVSSNLGPLGHKWKPQALMDDLCDASSRFALVTERAPPGKAKSKKKAPPTGKPVAFAHFRFTVEGEAREELTGVPVLLIRDLHVEPECQRKGLGRHLCQLLELAARKNAMQGVMTLIPAGDAGAPARAFLSSKLRGFECVDDDWEPLDAHLSAYAKSLVKKPAAPAPASPLDKPAKVADDAAAASPDSILAGPTADDAETKDETKATDAEAAAKLEKAFEGVAVVDAEAPAPAPAPALFGGFAPAATVETEKPKMSFADFGAAAPDEDVSSSEEEEEASDEDEDAAEADAGDEEADDILGQLVEMFKAENGREPTEEEVAQWVQTLKEAAAEGGLDL